MNIKALQNYLEMCELFHHEPNWQDLNKFKQAIKNYNKTNK